ncbi:MAG: hypothetical protein KBT88_04155 [Gammaproteobacteria bacterium]|nr:hypothetical protein [Gammaproteobacteria bacterium]MBQ0838957.1 hypothetical protein [Gammaproteobacteria bacterium]
MQNIHPQVLEFIGNEYKSVLQSAHGLVQLLTVAHLEDLNVQLIELRGAAQISQLVGMKRLFSEMATAVDTVISGDKAIDDLQPLLDQSLQLAEGLIETIVEQKSENPCILLPEMTALRRFRGAPPLYEYHLLKGIAWPSFASLAQDEEVIGPQTEGLKRLHHLYQLGLLDIIRNNNRQKALIKLFRVAGRLQKVAISERESDYWWVFAATIKGFAEQKLSLQPERIRLLAAVEKQLRLLVATPEEGARNPYPEGLWRAFVSLLAMTDMSSDERAQQIGVPELLFSDSAISSVRNAINGERDADKSIFESMALSVSSLRTLLDNADEAASLCNGEILNELNVGFEALADECEQAGFKGMARHYRQFCSRLKSCDEKGLPIEMLSEFTDAILHVECAMADFYGKRPQAEQIKAWEDQPLMVILQKSLLKTAQLAVVSETTSRLSDIKQLVDNVASGYASAEVTPELELAFSEIEGSASMLNMTRLASLAQRCLSLAKEVLFKDSDGEDGKAIEAFADTIVCLEYFLDGCMVGDSVDESSLDVANECLSTLGA